MQINTVEDALACPISEATETQLTAFKDGKAAYSDGGECYRQFRDTQMFWHAGYHVAQRRDLRLRLQAAERGDT